MLANRPSRRGLIFASNPSGISDLLLARNCSIGRGRNNDLFPLGTAEPHGVAGLRNEEPFERFSFLRDEDVAHEIGRDLGARIEHVVQQ